MTTQDTGGPAFPIVQDACPGVHSGGVESWGLTMRDYFAAKAMQAMCEEVSRYNHFESCAKDAYKLADAMLEARK